MKNGIVSNGGPEKGQSVRSNYEEILQLWLYEGLSPREIEARNVGLHKTRINEIIKDYRSSHPDVEAARQFFRAVILNKLNPSDVMRVASLVSRLGLHDVSLTLFVECVTLLSNFPEDPEGAIRAGLRIHDLEVTQKRTFDQIKAAAEAASSDVKSLRAEKESLVQTVESLKEDVKDLQRAHKIETKLNELGIDYDHMEVFIARQKILDSRHFTPRSAEVLASQLSLHDENPESASNRITTILGQYGSLSRAVSEIQDKLAEAGGRLADDEKKISANQKKLDEQQAKLADNNLKLAEQSKLLLTGAKGIKFGLGLLNLAMDPEHVSPMIVEALIEKLQQIKQIRDSGHWRASVERAKTLKDDIVSGILHEFPDDVVLKSDYTRMSSDHDALKKISQSDKEKLEILSTRNAILEKARLADSENVEYWKAASALRDLIVGHVSTVISGCDPQERAERVGKYVCRRCRIRTWQQISTANLSPDLSFICSRCRESQRILLEDVYQDSMKVALGLESLNTKRRPVYFAEGAN